MKHAQHKTTNGGHGNGGNNSSRKNTRGLDVENASAQKMLCTATNEGEPKKRKKKLGNNG